jgi:peptide/nickel transport system substrate-binding protein
VEENEPPNSYDPATGFFAGEDEILVNTYQELVMFNYTSLSEYAPILANSWSVSANYSTYSFSLRDDAYFANGHPYNSSVAWFNFYRVVLMNQVGAYYFTSLLYNGTTAYATGYNLPAGVDNALAANGYSLSSTNASLRQAQAANDLAAILSHFNPSNSTIQKIMSYPGQAVVVTGTYSVKFNLINPYLNFLQVVGVPGAGQVDPAFVDANGGVTPNQQNTYINTHTMGTAPYVVKSYVQGEVCTMVANPNYWAAKLPAGSTNVMLTPPKIPVVILQYTSSASQIIQSVESNTASLVGPLSLPALTPNYLPELAAYPGLVVRNFPNAPKFLVLESVMDTLQYPYNVTDFRVAIVHAINYSEIISSVGNGYTEPFVGPIGPGYPYYNPGNLPVYPYDPSSSIQLLKSAGFRLSLPNGTIINPAGKAPLLAITYTSDDPAETKIAQEMQIMFEDVGLQYTLNGVTTEAEESAISQPGTASGYPGMLIWYWYPSWSDAVYQDLVVQTNVVDGGISGDVSWFNNTQVNSLTTTLPFLTNPSQINQTVTQVYSIVYQQAPVAWLYAINPYWVQRSYVSGVFDNAGILGYYYALMYYGT